MVDRRDLYELNIAEEWKEILIPKWLGIVVAVLFCCRDHKKSLMACLCFAEYRVLLLYHVLEA